MEKSIKVIKNNLKLFIKNPIDGVSLAPRDNIYIWDVIIQGPADTYYEDGIFKCELRFPKDFPVNPPKFIFKTPIYHPNIYTNGNVCISILHPPGEDEFGYEKSEDRWRPVHSVNSILLSIISLLSSPNDESPANIDAAKDWRNYVNKVNKDFIKKVNKCIRDSDK